MIKMKFEIYGGYSYIGYSEGKTWNGWQCPLFDMEVALQIAKDFSAVNDYLVYDEATDSFKYKTEDYADGEFDTFSSVMKDGKKFYAIGAFSWCWDGEPT